jgi:hypothetical protein
MVLPCYTTLETSAISQNSPRYGFGSTQGPRGVPKSIDAQILANSFLANQEREPARFDHHARVEEGGKYLEAPEIGGCELLKTTAFRGN